ncbi:MAG: hypothetical protein E7242_03150 [Lachnospiraceae bacterium]|nr:hypothetical protein [Lachnospiraceae bacterium]
MSRKANIYGGGAQTNANGLLFEQTTSLNDALRSAGYYLNGCDVFIDNKHIGKSVPQQKVYTEFLSPMGIDYRNYNSKQWRPDECFINFSNKTAYIIEKKFQNTVGSVDEKLPGCDFKKKEYIKLFTPLGYKVEYIYVFNDWFKDRKYKDVLDYIAESNCIICFNEIPVNILGL